MKKITLFLAIVGMLSMFLTTELSAQLLVKFDGIDGEATVQGHEKWTDFSSIQFGVARQGSVNTGGVRQRSAAHMTEVNLTKMFDKSSIKLLEATTIGQIFKKVEIHLMKNGGNGKGMFIYLTITLENAAITNYSISSGGQRPEENVVVQFEKINFEHTLSDGSKIPFKWDLQSGSK
ncbi:MAG: type VI secretion system tube protein Hcp [Chitinophagales bacterium]